MFQAAAEGSAESQVHVGDVPEPAPPHGRHVHQQHPLPFLRPEHRGGHRGPARRLHGVRSNHDGVSRGGRLHLQPLP